MKIVITGILDVMAEIGADRVNSDKVTQYERELTRASGLPGVILCSFYPTGSLRSSQWGIVNRLNPKICELSAAKGKVRLIKINF